MHLGPGMLYAPSGFTIKELENFQDATTQTSYTSGSYSPSANKLIVVDLYTRAFAGVAQNPTSITGNGLTWDLVSSVDNDVLTRTFRYKALSSTTPTTGGLTVQFAASRTGVNMHIYEIDGVDTSGSNGDNAIGTTDTDQVTGGTSASADIGSSVDGAIAFFTSEFNGATTFTPDPDYVEIDRFELPLQNSISQYAFKDEQTCSISIANSSDLALILTELVAA